MSLSRLRKNVKKAKATVCVVVGRGVVVVRKGKVRRGRVGKPRGPVTAGVLSPDPERAGTVKRVG